MRIAAIDPGGTSGLAVIDTPIDVVLTMQHRDLMRVMEEVVKLEPDELVVEKFVVYPEAARLMGWSRTPAELVGIIKSMAEQFGIPVVEQAPSQKHGAFKLLKPLGLWKPKMGHAMDALAHAVYRSLYGHGYEKDPAVQAKLQQFLLEVE